MMHKRQRWIDRVKLFACILVAMGHFFMSVIEAEIIGETDF